MAGKRGRAKKPPVRIPKRTSDRVDVTLIRWMLSLTPAERLRALETNARSLMRLRAYRPKA